MLLGNRGSRSSVARRYEGFHPRGEELEERLVLTPIDLGGLTPPLLPNVASANPTVAAGFIPPSGPFGVLEAGGVPGEGAGYSVAAVGDVNNDGFEDYFVGAPTLSTAANFPTQGSGANSRAYLIFGSLAVTAGALQNVDWLALESSQNTATISTNRRVGDLNNLGNSVLAFNPVPDFTGVNPQTFPFAGITFFASQNPNSRLGASVSVVRGLPGGNALLIGAPNASGPTQGANAGTGRAYLVYTNNLAAQVNRLSGIGLDLDFPQNVAGAGINIVTFVNSTLNSRTGTAVAGVGDVITDGVPDLAIGAPNAAPIPTRGSTGAVYLVSGSFLPTTSQTIDLAGVGQFQNTNFFPGVLFTGANTGSLAGFSVAPAGDVEGTLTGANQATPDLLIGSPGAGTGGAAYLVNGASNLPALASQFPVVVNNVTTFFNRIDLGQIAVNPPPVNTPANPNLPVPGAVFSGLAAGAQTGFSVAPAGDFDGDAQADFMIGSPGVSNNAGQVNLFYGLPQIAANAFSGLTGVVNLGATSPAFPSATFLGANTGALLGFSMTQVGRVNSDLINEIAIGSPGYDNGSNATGVTDGAVFLIPGRQRTATTALTSTYTLTQAVAEGAVVQAVLFTITNTPGGNAGIPEYLGTSVSSQLTFSQSRTADNDNVADLIIGAPGYAVVGNRPRAGGVFIIQGALLQASTNPLPTPSVPAPPPPGPGPGPGPGGGGLAAEFLPGVFIPTTLETEFGPDRLVPQVSTLSRLNYQAIPLHVALNQYLPAQGFRQRISQYFFPKKHVKQFGSKYDDRGNGVNTLGSDVFTRGRFKTGETVSFKHPTRVIPTNRQRETYTPTPDIDLVRRRDFY